MNLFAIMVVGSIVSVASFSVAGEPADVGERAPKITAFTLDGELISLSSLLKNDAVYLYFWNTACQPCRDEVSLMKQLHDSYRRKIRLIGINTGLGEDIKEIRDYEDEYDIRHDLVFDKNGKVSEDYGVTETPMHIMINRRGRITYRAPVPLSIEEIKSRWSELTE